MIPRIGPDAGGRWWRRSVGRTERFSPTVRSTGAITGWTTPGLAAFHERRLGVLAGAGADLLAVETIPSAREARVLGRLLDRLDAGPPAWICFACRDGGRASATEPLSPRSAADLGRSARVSAVGVNLHRPEAPRIADPAASRRERKAVVAYPNGDGRYDPIGKSGRLRRRRRTSRGSPPSGNGSERRSLGGCCRTRPEDIRTIRAALTGESRMMPAAARNDTADREMS